MRYLIVLLLLSGVCRGQKQYTEKYTKVIVYRLIEMPDDGPCSVLDYIKKSIRGTVFTAESSDERMITDFKKESKKWKSEYHDCDPGYGSIDETPNMFIFSGISSNDTLFTTEGNHALVLPTKFKKYIDKDKRIEKSFTADFAEFFQRDFKEDIWFSLIGDLDSIPNNKILFKGKAIQDVKKIEDIGNNILLINVDTIHSDGTILEAKKYWDGNTYTFNYSGKLETIEIFLDGQFYTDGIKPGDREDVLLKKYPNSTKRQYPGGTNYEKIKHNYSYVINVENKMGRVIFNIKDKIVNSITYSFPI